MHFTEKIKYFFCWTSYISFVIKNIIKNIINIIHDLELYNDIPENDEMMYLNKCFDEKGFVIVYHLKNKWKLNLPDKKP